VQNWEISRKAQAEDEGWTELGIMTAPEPCAPNARPLTTLGEQQSFPPPWGGGSFEGVQVSATVPLESCLDLVLGGPHGDPLDVEYLGGGHDQG